MQDDAEVSALVRKFSMVIYKKIKIWVNIDQLANTEHILWGVSHSQVISNGRTPWNSVWLHTFSIVCDFSSVFHSQHEQIHCKERFQGVLKGIATLGIVYVRHRTQMTCTIREAGPIGFE